MQHKAKFDVLGVSFGIEADSSGLLEPFEELLRRFLVVGGEAPSRALRLRVQGDDGACSLECDGQSYSLAGGEPALLAHTYSLLLHWVFGQVDDFFLLHGSAVARAGEGLVLSGQSGMGKTTLGCAMAAGEGWQLLSDDVAPFSLKDGALHPFPKALSLRPGLASPADLAAGIPLPVLDEGVKRILPAEAIGLRVAQQPVHANTLVFLEPAVSGPAPAANSLAVVVHRRVPGLLERVRGLEDVIAAHEQPGRRFSQFTIDTKVPARCLSRIEELCRESGALVIGTARESQRAQPDFEGEARLEALNLDQGVRYFLRNLWGTAQYRLVAELGGGAGLYRSVARILSEVRCLRLCPGRYEGTLALLRGLDLEPQASDTAAGE